jgi:hypothetical protein
MFGLLVLTLVMIQVQFVPVWDEDREAKHMDEVLGQFAHLASDVDRQVQNDTTVSLADPVQLDRSPGFRFFGGEGLPGTLAFEAASAGSGVSLSSPRLTIFEQNGQQLVAVADQASWIPLDNVNDAYTDISNLRVLRVQIPWPADPNDCDTDLVAILHIRDAVGDELAKVIFTCHDGQGERSINTAVFRRETTADGFSQVSGDTEAIFQNADAEFFYIDVMRSELLLGPVLAAMTGPLSMDMEDLGLSALYVLVYDDSTGGTLGGGGSLVGQTVEPYPATPTLYGGGRLVFTAHNQRFVDQQYVFEHGAVLRVQADGAAMVVPPRFEVSPTTQQTRIEWDLPSLLGATQSLGGATAATVSSDRAGAGLTMLAGAATLTVDIPTAYPDTWKAFFDREMLESGLTLTPDPQYSVVANVASVTLTVLGTDTLDPDLDDLLLEFGQADIDIDLTASG